MNFKNEFELIFNVKTNSDIMKEVLEIITKNIEKEIAGQIKDKTEVECTAEIKRIDVKTL